jgi:hypothetical protein
MTNIPSFYFQINDKRKINPQTLSKNTKLTVQWITKLMKHNNSFTLKFSTYALFFKTIHYI